MERKLTIKEVESGLVLYDGNTEIETYSLAKAIDFSKLMAFLLKDEVKTVFSIDKTVDEKDPQKDKLVSLISEILKEYEKRVVAYKDFEKANKPA